MRKVFIALVLLGAALVRVQAAEPIRIGLSLGLTGQYAELADAHLKAYQLWARDVNAAGGLLGRPVQLLHHDDRSDPAAAAQIYQRLILEDKVDLVLSPYSSPVTSAVAVVTEKHGYPLLAAGAAADELYQKKHRYLFGVIVTANKYAAGFLELLARNNIDAIATISADDLFARSAAASVKDWAQRFGLRGVFHAEFKKGSPDLSELVAKARASGAQALLVCGHYEESVAARLALKRIGWRPRAYYATVGPALQRYQQTLGADAALTFTSSLWEPSSRLPGSREFERAYRTANGSPPAYQAAMAYAAGQVLAAAVQTAGTTDRERVRDTLASLSTTTIVGRYGVDRTGRQIGLSTTVVQWQNDQKEIVAPKELMTAEPIWAPAKDNTTVVR